MSENIHYYTKNAEQLTKQYNSLLFESVHKEWLSEVPAKGFALDIGAGSGRDARYLAGKGLSVVAVEPSAGIRERAQQYTVGESVHWINDKLPELTKVFELQTKFDLILLSAVWMHIPPSERERCIRKLSTLLKAGGKLIISLRHGVSTDERTMYTVSADELSRLAAKFGLSFSTLSESQRDELGREEVSWQTVMLSLPDDGTGAFPLLRNIIVNDNKSSTYKVALLRALLRVAEGHPGAVIERNDNFVVLPMGLVALYWIKLFKPLIDTYHLPQNSNVGKGLGFIKAEGWEALNSYSAADFYVGASFSDPAIARAVYKTIKDVAATIKSMPATYITLPDSGKQVFDAEISRTRPSDKLVLDADFLTSIGKFVVPAHIWDSLSRFSTWIEPSLVNEWVSLMKLYSRSSAMLLTSTDYMQALTWEDPKRSTSRVRQRVEQLQLLDTVNCCWSGKKISAAYAIDHAMPFARWPNNDLWNLLPTLNQLNAQKSDKLPTAKRMMGCRDIITHWWQQAWSEHTNEFFIQANLALPKLNSRNRSFDDVFEAMVLQRDRIKDFQQLTEW